MLLLDCKNIRLSFSYLISNLLMTSSSSPPLSPMPSFVRNYLIERFGQANLTWSDDTVRLSGMSDADRRYYIVFEGHDAEDKRKTLIDVLPSELIETSWLNGKNSARQVSYDIDGYPGPPLSPTQCSLVLYAKVMDQHVARKFLDYASLASSTPGRSSKDVNNGGVTL